MCFLFLGYSVLLIIKFGDPPLEIWTWILIHYLLSLLGIVCCYTWQLLSVVFGLKRRNDWCNGRLCGALRLYCLYYSKIFWTSLVKLEDVVLPYFRREIFDIPFNQVKTGECNKIFFFRERDLFSSVLLPLADSHVSELLNFFPPLKIKVKITPHLKRTSQTKSQNRLCTHFIAFGSGLSNFIPFFPCHLWQSLFHTMFPSLNLILGQQLLKLFSVDKNKTLLGG